MATTPKYFTYLKEAVKAKKASGSNPMVRFQEGKGYWLTPRGAQTRAPKPPPPGVDPVTGLPLRALTAAQINVQAGRQATSALAPERAEIERQRGIAAGRAKADQAAMLGLGVVTAEMQKGLVPGVQGAYSGAAAEIAGLAQGFSGAMGERMSAGQQASVDFAKSQGQDVGQLGPNVQDAQNVSYGLGGFIPGSSLAAQGAAAGAHAAAIPAITALALKGDYQRALFEARSQDDEYAQQLIAVASKYPQYRDEALQELRNYELQKGDMRLKGKASLRDDRQVAIQERAQSLYERQFGETQVQNQVENAQTAVENAYRFGQLQLETKKAQAAVEKAAAAGRQPNSSLSKLYGYIVDANGQPILSGGKKIKVVNSTANKPGPKGEGAQARAEAFRETTANMDSFVRDTFKDKYGWLPDFDPAKQPGNSAYRRARARLVKRYWPDVRTYATAAGRTKLRAEFGRLVDAVLASHGIAPVSSGSPRGGR